MGSSNKCQWILGFLAGASIFLLIAYYWQQQQNQSPFGRGLFTNHNWGQGNQPQNYMPNGGQQNYVPNGNAGAPNGWPQQQPQQQGQQWGQWAQNLIPGRQQNGNWNGGNVGGGGGNWNGGGNKPNFNPIQFATGAPYFLLATSVPQISANCGQAQCKVVRAWSNGGKIGGGNGNWNPPYAQPNSFVLTQSNTDTANSNLCYELGYAEPTSQAGRYTLLNTGPINLPVTSNPNLNHNRVNFAVVATGSVTRPSAGGQQPVYSWVAVSFDGYYNPVDNSYIAPQVWLLSTTPNLPQNAIQSVNQQIQAVTGQPIRLAPVDPTCNTNVYASFTPWVPPTNWNGGGRAPGVAAGTSWSQFGQNLANQAQGSVSQLTNQATGQLQNLIPGGTTAVPAKNSWGNFGTVSQSGPGTLSGSPAWGGSAVSQNQNPGLASLHQQQPQWQQQNPGFGQGQGQGLGLGQVQQSSNWPSQGLVTGLGLGTRGEEISNQ